jgi:hypothetical protein
MLLLNKNVGRERGRKREREREEQNSRHELLLLMHILRSQKT